ncbi:NPCBM/NEW2 domain-containing protein [Streptomyces sp. CB00316]|uniref:NPCBM/NEW2 domain-containing protein n=1 Tax=Streptomyces sp. CB00316 TaxID=1703932 RepID=UPI001F270CB5|nr:NPCBM/NEW2 domain-containing protein [Streptomyces sp. CB00316]
MDGWKVAKLSAWATVAAAVAGALIAGVFQLATAQGGDDDKSAGAPAPSISLSITPPAGTPSPTPPPSASASQWPTSEGTPDSPENSPPPPATAPQVRYISEIDEKRSRTAALVHQGERHECLTSLTVRTNVFQATKTFEFAIDPEWDTFSTLAGMDTAPPFGNVMRFTVYVDDEQVATHQLSDRQAVEITVPVRGRSALKLVTDTVKAGGHPAGGYGAWGNARFTAGAEEKGGC